jgi:hypothetical protein
MATPDIVFHPKEETIKIIEDVVLLFVDQSKGDQGSSYFRELRIDLPQYFIDEQAIVYREK